MTEEEQALTEILIDKFPEFGIRWEKYRDIEIDDEEDEEFISIYTVAQEFSEYIIALYIKAETETLKKAFLEIEYVVKNGSGYMSNAALVGFVEGILFLRSHKGIPLNAFDEWLGTTSKAFWYEMHNFFTTGSTS